MKRFLAHLNQRARAFGRGAIACLAAVAKHRAELIADLAALYGLASVGVGLWGWSPNLSLTVTGGIILAGLTAGKLRNSPTHKRER